MDWHSRNRDASRKRSLETDEQSSYCYDSQSTEELPSSSGCHDDSSLKWQRGIPAPLLGYPWFKEPFIHPTPPLSAFQTPPFCALDSAQVERVDASSMFTAKKNNQAKLVSQNGCKCGKTKCLKQYCPCFRCDIRCTDTCVCANCYNDGKHEREREASIRHIRMSNHGAFKGTALELQGLQVCTPQGTLRMIRGCRCKRSNCQKKYCECFAAALKCSANCVCEECQNGSDSGDGTGTLPQERAMMAAQQQKKPPAYQQRVDVMFRSKKPTQTQTTGSFKKFLGSSPSIDLGSAAPVHMPNFKPISSERYMPNSSKIPLPFSREFSMPISRELSGIQIVLSQRSAFQSFHREKYDSDSSDGERGITEEEIKEMLAPWQTFLANSPRDQFASETPPSYTEECIAPVEHTYQAIASTYANMLAN